MLALSVTMHAAQTSLECCNTQHGLDVSPVLSSPSSPSVLYVTLPGGSLVLVLVSASITVPHAAAPEPLSLGACFACWVAPSGREGLYFPRGSRGWA